jgi:hypothetical protein
MTITKLTPKQLHEIHEIPEVMDYATIQYQYVQLTQLWRCIGYKCKKCDIPFKSKSVLINHRNTCRVINTISRKKKDAYT